jgi:hypothetical protein
MIAMTVALSSQANTFTSPSVTVTILLTTALKRSSRVLAAAGAMLLKLLVPTTGGSSQRWTEHRDPSKRGRAAQHVQLSLHRTVMTP